jgi:hypothetical protein
MDIMKIPAGRVCLSHGTGSVDDTKEERAHGNRTTGECAGGL